jgi:hypothetical protein
LLRKSKDYFPKALDKPFFKEFANRSLEEKRYMFQQIQFAYSSPNFPPTRNGCVYDNSFTTLANFGRNIKNANEWAGFGSGFYALKNNFLDMYDINSDLDKLNG